MGWGLAFEVVVHRCIKPVPWIIDLLKDAMPKGENGDQLSEIFMEILFPECQN
jgi:hypothetical protein